MSRRMKRRTFLKTTAAAAGLTVLGGSFRSAAQLTESALVGNVAIRAGRRIAWDGPNMKAANVSDPAVERVIRREYRAGWTL